MLSKVQMRSAAVGVLAALSAVVLSGCGEKKAAPQQARAVPVEVTVVELSDAVIHTELPGRTSAYRVAEVRPQVSGIIEKRLFEEGGDVKEGQSLYQIDSSLYKANVASARAALLQAEANLVSTRADAKRSTQLVKINAVSKQANDAAQANYKVALANVEAARAQLDVARINLRYTEVKSPIAGKVSLSEVTPGALVTANQSARLTVVQQLDPIYVDVTQSYDKLAELRAMIQSGAMKVSEKGEADVSIVLDNGSVYQHPGKLTFQDALVDETTGSVRIRAVVPNPDHILMPGQFVRAKLTDGVREKVVLLDQRATMRHTTGAPYVYVVNKENKVEIRDIVISSAEGDRWVVEKGLNAGDKVIVLGIQKVRPGVLVAYGDPAQKPAAQPAK